LFRKAETESLRVSEPKYLNPLSHAFVEACERLGIPRNPDFNGPSQAGAGFYRVTQKNGQRWSAADAYLRPALARGNLTVWTGIHVTRALIENARATGVEYLQANSQGPPSVHQVPASRAVILCAGAVGSPQLLALSGVGPAGQLEALKIRVAADLPGVGENVQDHLAVGVPYSCTRPVSLNGVGTLANRLKYLLWKRGPLSSNIAEAGAFTKSRTELAECDLQFHFAPVHYVDHGFAKPGGHGFSIIPALLTPRSRGRIVLRSANPLEPPLIDPAYLSDPADLAPLVEGVKLAKRLAEAAPFDSYRGEPVLAPEDPEAYVRGHAETLYHPVGSCKMGQDALSVVDARLQVHGVAGLRVADASVMPVIVGGNVNAATIVIGEKAAQIIREGALA
jgi:choline dehydrogenase